MTSVNVTSDALLRSLSKLKRDTLFLLCLKLQFVSDESMYKTLRRIQLPPNFFFNCQSQKKHLEQRMSTCFSRLRSDDIITPSKRTCSLAVTVMTVDCCRSKQDHALIRSRAVPSCQRYIYILRADPRQ